MCKLPTYAEDFAERPYQQKILMEGMLNEKPADLIPLASSWLNPPGLVALSGCESSGYDRSQRAFLVSALEKKLSLRVEATTESPIVNPCFVIKNWRTEFRSQAVH